MRGCFLTGLEPARALLESIHRPGPQTLRDIPANGPKSHANKAGASPTQRPGRPWRKVGSARPAAPASAADHHSVRSIPGKRYPSFGASRKVESAISRVLSRTIIHLGRPSPAASSNLPGSTRGRGIRFPIWSCSGWGLPCHDCCQPRGALLPHHFTLTSRGRRYIFCGTFRGLAPPRRYLASCPTGARTFLPMQASSDCLADSATNHSD